MSDVDTLKTQQKLIKERIDLCMKQNVIVNNLRRIKARSKFIMNAQLDLNIYKFQPNDYLELIANNEKSKYTAPYEEFKEKQKKEEEERKAKELASKKNKPLQGNLALNFLFKDQDLSEIIKIKSGTAQGGPVDSRSTVMVGEDSTDWNRMTTLSSTDMT
jgi:hypothetical protein